MARRARGNGIPWASLFGVFLILAVISVFSYVLWYKSTQTDHVNKDGCPTDISLIPSTWIALIDATTKFDDSQILALNNLGEKLIKLAPKYAEIKIYMMTGESISKKNLVASVCNPGDPNNINPWTQSQRQVRNNFNINYKGKLTAGLDKIKVTQGADNSLILDSIQNLALIEKLNSNKKKNLFIISDFMENDGALFNFYKQVPEYKALSKSGMLTTKLAALGSNASQTRVYMMLLPNEFKVQKTDKFIKFWRSYFIDSNAALNNLDGKGYCIFTNCNL
mgnify:FL=1